MKPTSLFVLAPPRSPITHRGNRGKFLAAAVALLAVSVMGMAAPQSEKRRDLHGDPLPEGVALRLGTIQRRAVEAQIAVSPDGRSVYSVRAGKYFCIWDATTGQLRAQRTLPGDQYNSLSAFSPDGRLLASHVASTAELRIREVAAGKILRTLPLTNRDGPRYVYVSALCFSPDGKCLAAVDGAEQHRLRVWNLNNGRVIFNGEFRQGGIPDRLVLAVKENRLYALVVSTSAAGLRCWDVADRELAWQRTDIRSFTIAITSDGRILYARQQLRGSDLQAVELSTGRNVALEHPLPLGRHAQLCLTPDGRTLLAGDETGVTVWDWQQGTNRHTLAGAGEELVVFPDGKSILSNNGSLQRWDLATGQPMWTDTSEWGHTGQVLALAFSADGKRLASGAADGTVRLWDAATGRPLRIWRGHQARRPIGMLPWKAAGVISVDISVDGRRLFSAGSENRLKVWDAGSADAVRTVVPQLTVPFRIDPIRHEVRIHRDGRRASAVSGCFHEGRGKQFHRLTIWDLRTGERRSDHSIDLESVADYSLDPDGDVARIGPVLMDLATGKERIRLRQFQGDAAAMSRDGFLVAGVAEGGGVGIWESATGQRISALKRIGWTSQTIFHPNNRFLATNDLDGVQLWDASRGESILRLRAPEPVRIGALPLDRYIPCLAFSADGRWLAAGMPDGTILLWDIRLPASQPQPLTVGQLESLWIDLADTDAAKAWRAVNRLVESPNEALSFLRRRIQPYPTTPAEVTRKLLTDLDSDSFAHREAAMKRLKELGLQAEPALRAELRAKPSLEQRRRVEMILTALQETAKRESSRPLSVNDLRQLRALIVLERMASPKARRLLEKIAQGPHSARWTRQAAAALACLP